MCIRMQKCVIVLRARLKVRFRLKNRLIGFDKLLIVSLAFVVGIALDILKMAFY